MARSGQSRRTGVLLAAALLCVPGHARAADGAPKQEPERRDLAELTRAAKRNYPGIRASEHAIDAAEARLDEARISPYFQLSATSTFTVAPDQSGTPTFSRDDQLPLENDYGPVVSIGVEGAIPIYTFGKLAAARDAARAQVDAAKKDKEKSIQRIRWDVRRAYFALQLALDAEQLVREVRGKLQQAQDKVEEALEQGDADISRMDKWRLETARARLESRASENQRLEASSREALQILTGIDTVRIPACPSRPVELDLRSLEHYVALAVKNRPELGMLEAAKRARKADLDAKWSDYFPSFALALRAAFSYGPGITDQTNPFIQDPANRRQLAALLVARWPLDFYGTNRRVQRARAQLAETRAQTAEARRGMRAQVADTYNRVKDARRRERAWAKGEQSARSWMVAAAQSYEVGTLDAKEIIDAVEKYAESRAKHLQAIRDYNTAVAKLVRVTSASLIEEGAWEQSCR